MFDLRISTHEEVETFVVADEAEEKQNGLVDREIERLACFVFRNRLTEIVIERMDGEGDAGVTLLGQETQAVLLDTFRHRHETVDAADIIADEPLVPEMGFVRNDVVQHGYHLYAVSPTETGDRTQTRRHEGNPELDDQQFDAGFLDLSCCAEPSEGIDAVHTPADGQTGRLRSVRILRFAGEEKIGVLESKSEDLHLVSFRNELLREPLVESRQTTPVGPRCT